MTLGKLKIALMDGGEGLHKDKYLEYARLCHPDISPDNIELKEVFTLLEQWKENNGYIAIIDGKYKIIKKMCNGDISNIYKCTNGQTLKVSSHVKYNKLLHKEIDILKEMATFGGDTFNKMYPKYVDSVKINGKIGHITETILPLAPLTYFKDKKLPGQHLVWIAKRCFDILGFIHRNNIIHNAVTLDHILINHETHGVCLIDWCFVNNTKKISPEFKWAKPPEVINKEKSYASSDIYTLSKTLLFIYNRDNTLLERFFESCCFENIKRRPNDAWELVDELSELAQKLYGEPKFVELKLEN